MTNPLPKFDAPPVIETVLSVQFPRLPGFTTAHAGWFWKSYLNLPGEWPKVVEAARIDDQTERFGPDAGWHRLGLRMSPGGEAQRTQIVRADDERMLQIQDSRFVLNWRKQSQTYPSFEVLLPEFRNSFGTFTQFAADAGFGALEPDQWEVTYVNHINKGDMWETVSDWQKIIPGLYSPPAVCDGPLETLNGDWRYTLKPDIARLYISLKHQRRDEGDQRRQIMVLQLTARGGVSAAEQITWEAGLRLGHEGIVRTFAELTSPEAHGQWRRTV